MQNVRKDFVKFANINFQANICLLGESLKVNCPPGSELPETNCSILTIAQLKFNAFPIYGSVHIVIIIDNKRPACA